MGKRLIIPEIPIHDLSLLNEGGGSDNSKEYCNCADCKQLRLRRDAIFNKWHQKLIRLLSY